MKLSQKRIVEYNQIIDLAISLGLYTLKEKEDCRWLATSVTKLIRKLNTTNSQSLWVELKKRKLLNSLKHL